MALGYTVDDLNNMLLKAKMTDLETYRVNVWSLIILNKATRSAKLYLERAKAPVEILFFAFAEGNENFLILTISTNSTTSGTKLKHTIRNRIFVRGKITPVVGGNTGRLRISLDSYNSYAPVLTYKTESGKTWLLDFKGKKLNIPNRYWGAHRDILESGLTARYVYYLHNKLNFMDTNTAYVETTMDGSGSY